VNPKVTFSVVLGSLFCLVFIIAITPSVAVEPVLMVPEATAVGAAMWIEHPFDVVYQGFIMLAGAISILLLLGSDKSGGMFP
jgi:hypothetical protein